MTRLLKEGGYKSFDPYQFDDQMVRKVMALLQASADPTAANNTADLIKQSAEVPVGEKNNYRWLIYAVIAAAIIIGWLVLSRFK